MASEAKWINGLNATAVAGTRTKMRGDSNVGAVAPVVIPVELDVATGIISGPKVGCYTLVYFVEAAAQGLAFDTFKTTTTTKGNMGRFYSKEMAMADVAPWKKVHSLIEVGSGQSLAKTKELGDYAYYHCPAYHILQADDITMATTVKVSHSPPKNGGITSCYDLEAYKAFGAQVGKNPNLAEFVQKGTGTWFCKNESTNFPGCLMEMKSEGISVPFGMDPPLGTGSFANPVANCLFGTVSFYVHTFALLLALEKVSVNTLKASLKTNMNKRKMMGIDENAKAFEHFDVEVELDCSGATDALIEKVRQQADLMCPSMHGVTHRISYDVDVEKISDNADCCVLL